MIVRQAGARRRGAASPTVKLHLSFRSTDDVLAAVDRVFAEPEVRRGITPRSRSARATRRSAPMRPAMSRSGRRSAPTRSRSRTTGRRPIDHAQAPAVRVAETRRRRRSSTGSRTGEIIEGTGKRLSAGDILVLVRKRDRFVHALSRSLKNREHPGRRRRPAEPARPYRRQGPDRARPLPDPAGGRSVAGRRAAQPDLRRFARTRCSRSPARARPALSLIASLRRKADADADLAAVVARLDAWATEAAFKPVFEFYAGLLARDGVRRKMIARLGPEAGDILDEFLSFCLAEERTGLPGLEAFLSTLESAGPEIKREMDQTPRRGPHHDRACRQGPGGAGGVPGRWRLGPVQRPASAAADAVRGARPSIGRARAICGARPATSPTAFRRPQRPRVHASAPTTNTAGCSMSA